MKVTAKNTIKANGQYIRPGEQFHADGADLDRLLALGAVVPADDGYEEPVANPEESDESEKDDTDSDDPSDEDHDPEV